MDTNHPDYIAPPQVLVDLKDALDAYSPEWSGDGVEEHYLSIPVGHNEAIEIEHETANTSGFTAPTLWVYARAWAPDHGMNSETLLAVVGAGFDYLVPGIVKAFADEQDRVNAQIEAAMGPGE